MHPEIISLCLFMFVSLVPPTLACACRITLVGGVLVRRTRRRLRPTPLLTVQIEAAGRRSTIEAATGRQAIDCGNALDDVDGDGAEDQSVPGTLTVGSVRERARVFGGRRPVVDDSDLTHARKGCGLMRIVRNIK